MRAITPVIAIVVLLVMTISAGGLAYLTLTTYQEEAARGGMAGAEGTFQAIGEQVRIESVQDGKVIMRNIGSRTIEDFEPLLVINGIPVQGVSSKTTLAPGETTVVDLRIESNANQPDVINVYTPSGNTVTITHTGKCTTVDLFNPSGTQSISSAQCYYAPNLVSCEVDGVCTVDEDDFENAFNCPQDCGYLMFVASVPVTTPDEQDVYQFLFNGTHWKMAKNITDTAGVAEGVSAGAYDSSRNIMAVYQNEGIMYNNLSYSFNSSGGWSAPVNTTLDKVGGNIAIAEGPNGQIMVTAQARPDTSSIPVDMVKSILWNGSSWGAMKNVSLSEYADLGPGGCGIWACHAMFSGVGYFGSTPIAVWAQETPSGYAYIQSAVWDGSGWTNYKNISTTAHSNRPYVTSSLAGDEVMAVWTEYSMGSGTYQVRTSLWDGSSWSAYENVTEPVPAWSDVRNNQVARDAVGQYIVAYMNQSNDPREGYYVVRSKSGVWSAPQRVSPFTNQTGENVFLLGNLAGAVTLAWGDVVDDHVEYKTSFWNSYEARLQTPIRLVYCDVAGGMQCRETEP